MDEDVELVARLVSAEFFKGDSFGGHLGVDEVVVVLFQSRVCDCRAQERIVNGSSKNQFQFSHVPTRRYTE